MDPGLHPTPILLGHDAEGQAAWSCQHQHQHGSGEPAYYMLVIIEAMTPTNGKN